MFDCMTGYAWWQPLMLASCKWLRQWVPSHQESIHTGASWCLTVSLVCLVGTI